MFAIRVLIVVLIVLAIRANASASCTAATSHVNIAYNQFARFESKLFKEGVIHEALRAYATGATETGKARAEQCDDRNVVSRVLLVSGAFSVIHATLELNASPDNDRPRCASEHRDVAKSDIADAWLTLSTIKTLGVSPPRYSDVINDAKLAASRLGMALPSLSTSTSARHTFFERYIFQGRGECFHNPAP